MYMNISIHRLIALLDKLQLSFRDLFASKN